jgi:hypothetical protein
VENHAGAVRSVMEYLEKGSIYQQLVPLECVDAEVLVNRSGSIYVSRIVASPEPPKKERRGINPIQFNKTAIWRALPRPLRWRSPSEFVNVTPAFSGHFEFSGVVTTAGADVRDKALSVGHW